MSNWELNHTDRTSWEWHHPDHEEHYLLVAKAAPEKDEAWYVLPHIGVLSPDDHRYDGPDRVRCTSAQAAQEWADDYLDNHPNGHNPDDLAAQQNSYNPETGEVVPIAE